MRAPHTATQYASVKGDPVSQWYSTVMLPLHYTLFHTTPLYSTPLYSVPHSISLYSTPLHFTPLALTRLSVTPCKSSTLQLTPDSPLTFSTVQSTLFVLHHSLTLHSISPSLIQMHSKALSTHFTTPPPHSIVNHPPYRTTHSTGLHLTIYNTLQEG